MKHRIIKFFSAWFISSTALIIAMKAVPFLWQHQSSAAFEACVVIILLTAICFCFSAVLMLDAVSTKGKL